MPHVKFYALILCTALAWATSSAQAQGIGLAGLLNPEGSRLFPQSLVLPRHPGKPDPRWRIFNWKSVDLTSKGLSAFRLYFYEEEEWTARFAAPMIQSQIESLEQVFDYSPSQSFSYLLFASLREFQQATIFNISEGVQGITSTTERTMAIPYWGETESFRHISMHEMVHQFQVQKANDRGGGNALENLGTVPLWFIEGMAEYFSLEGIDPETAQYVRDLLLHPDDKRDYKIPKFFDEQPLDFINVYKMGQARIDFLETSFGKGTVRSIFDAAIEGNTTYRRPAIFESLVAQKTKKTPSELEQLWVGYLNKRYRTQADGLQQAMTAIDTVEAAGETLDEFAISPDGALLATRTIDPLSGVVSIQLMTVDGKDKQEVTHDNKPGTFSLFFFQFPVLALGNNAIAYVVGTPKGPELALRKIERRAGEKPRLGGEDRYRLHEHDIIQGSSPSFAPGEQKLVLVGLDPQGRQNLYVIDAPPGATGIRKLTEGYYSWRNPSWDVSGIIVASDKTPEKHYALFQVNPETGEQKLLTQPTADQGWPVRSGDSTFFQSWQSGTSQIHRQVQGQPEQRLTDAKTMFTSPKLGGDFLYALGFRSGRFHLFRIPKQSWLKIEVPGRVLPLTETETSPWQAKLADFAPGSVEPYRPFRSSGTRIDNLIGFFGSGGVGGIAGSVSDLMRNYSISGEFTALGALKYSSAAAFLTVQEGRTSYIAGAYHTAQERLDSVFERSTSINTYLYREFGGLGALQYPLTPFSFVDLQLRLGGVSRTEFSNPALSSLWDEVNPGSEVLVAPTARIGYDRILYEAFSGPLKGYGLLAESETDFFPARRASAQRFRLDASHYLQLFSGRTVLATQLLAGAAFGSSFKNPFFVLSDDIMRAYPFGDNRLRGNYLAAGKVELRFPIGTFFGFPPLRGLGAFDYGTIFRNTGEARQGLTSSYTGGLSLNLPPLSINFLLSFPGKVAAGPPVESPVAHFTLRYLYL